MLFILFSQVYNMILALSETDSNIIAVALTFSDYELYNAVLNQAYLINYCMICFYVA